MEAVSAAAAAHFRWTETSLEVVVNRNVAAVHLHTMGTSPPTVVAAG